MQYNVHVMTEVRVKISGINANSEQLAAQEAQQFLDGKMHDYLDREINEEIDPGIVVEHVEFTEGEPLALLVDPVIEDGDVDYENSIWLTAEGKPLEHDQWIQVTNKTRLNGLYWAKGTKPCDICSGKEKSFVSLLEIAFDPDGEFKAEPVSNLTGDYDSSYDITHVKPYKAPG